MNIVSSNAKYSISLGGADTWQTLCSTIRHHLSSNKKQLSNAFAFLKNGCCMNRDCMETAREFNLIRDELAKLSPDQIVYDEKEPKKQPPWGNNISPVITSCANYLTTGDGDDLLAEIVKILVCSAYSGANVEIK